jgi:hypothetical protein
MTNNKLWFSKRRGQDIWFNQIGGGVYSPPGPPAPSPPSPGGGLTANTTNPNNSNGLVAGNIPGIGTSCGCSYDLNCWDNSDPSTLNAYTGLPTQACPPGTQLNEPNNSITTYSGTCYDSACPGLGQSYNNLPTNACPGGTQLTQPTCTPTTCYTGTCIGNTAQTGATGYNGVCPGGTTSVPPYCGNIVIGPPAPGPGA